MLRKTKEIENLEKELEEVKGTTGKKGVKGIRDTLREIDESILKDDSSD